VLIISLVLILDQAVKIWIKTNLEYGAEYGIFGLSWARIHFVENEGMAFGLSFGGPGGKLVLSLFRIAAAIFLVYILRTLVRTKEPYGLLACFALITAGATGNIVDSAFYGLIFTESSFHGGVAEMFPEDGGYAGLFFGRVVDMLYFPLIDTTLPDWVPLWGGQRFEFFKPVVNIADASISTGVISLLVFYTRFLRTGTSTKRGATPQVELQESKEP
jgi:signal peptidase II